MSGPHAVAIEPVLAAALADEIAGAALSAANLAYALGEDGDVLRRHMGVLQDIDRITQVLLAVADVLRADRPLAERLAAVPLEALAARLPTVRAAA